MNAKYTWIVLFVPFICVLTASVMGTFFLFGLDIQAEGYKSSLVLAIGCGSLATLIGREIFIERAKARNTKD